MNIVLLYKPTKNYNTLKVGDKVRIVRPTGKSGIYKIENFLDVLKLYEVYAINDCSLCNNPNCTHPHYSVYLIDNSLRPRHPGGIPTCELDLCDENGVEYREYNRRIQT